MSKALYIHVPFCENICAYCDFTRVKCHGNLIDKWLIQLAQEINQRINTFDIDTIYIGGGTPSSLSVSQLETLLELIKPYSANVLEYTIEINPENINEAKIKLLQQYGVNRISIGIQTINESILKKINRFHNNQMVIDVIALFKSFGITNISCDCMFGLPDQSIQDIKDTLDFIMAQDIPHISIYALTIEENSQFNRDGITKIDEDLEADMYDFIVNYLQQHHYLRYEISNFAKDGYQSKHNLHYWNYDDFIGISIGASGKENGVRYENVTNFDKYFKGIYIESETKLSIDEQMFEYIMMGLRKRCGICIAEFNQRFNADLIKHYQIAINQAIEKQYLIIENGYILCSDYGYNLLHDVLELFIW